MPNNRIKEIRTAKKLTLEKVAESVGLSVGYVQRLENDTRNLSVKHLPAFAKALSVDQRELIKSVDIKQEIVAPAANPRRDIIMPDGEKINVEKLSDELAKKVRAVLSAYSDAEVWRLNTGVIAGLGHAPGTFLLVDLSVRPKPRDIVLAEYGKIPIFRQWAPPLLCSSPINVADWADILYVVGHDAATVRGVVVDRLPI